MKEKVRKLLEEFGVAAAEPVHGAERPKSLKVSFGNKDIYSAESHKQAEEVESPIIESYTRKQLSELFEALDLDTDKYTFEYLAEELGFEAREFLNESTGRRVVLYEAKGSLMDRAKKIAAKTGLALTAVLAMIGGTGTGRLVGDAAQFNQANQAYTQQIADATRDKSNMYRDFEQGLLPDGSPIDISNPSDRDINLAFTDNEYAAIKAFEEKYKELYGKSPSESEIAKGTGLYDKYKNDPRFNVETKYTDKYTTAFPELVKSNFLKPELKKTGTEEGIRSASVSALDPEFLDSSTVLNSRNPDPDDVDKAVNLLTKDMSQKYMSKSDADKAYSDAKSSYEARGGARDIGTAIGAGVSALGLGAAALAKSKNHKKDNKELSESYTREELMELFEALELDTHKYTFEYLAEELGFEKE